MPQERYPLLCLDTETTNHGELLEISIFDIEGNEVYHRYFKPHAKSWPDEIHHITPEMVSGCKRFSAHRGELQNLLNSADCLLGCALSNDLHTLRRYGLSFKPGLPIMDIQHWYWLLNDTSNRLERQQTGLSAIADHYGLGFGDSQPHSATADTRLTLESFKTLVKDFLCREFKDRQGLGENLDNNSSERLKEITNLYEGSFRHAMDIHRMLNIRGYVNVLKREQGFSFRYSRFELTDNPNVVLSIAVDDRIKAEIDMREHFETKQVKGYTGIYDFTKQDFEYIRAYQNSIDLEEFLEREEKILAEKQYAREQTFKYMATKQGSTPGHKRSVTRVNTLAMRTAKRHHNTSKQ